MLPVTPVEAPACLLLKVAMLNSLRMECGGTSSIYNCFRTGYRALAYYVCILWYNHHVTVIHLYPFLALCVITLYSHTVYICELRYIYIQSFMYNILIKYCICDFVCC